MNNNLKPKPKFRHLKFASEAIFEKWLFENTYKIVEIRDNGQDLIKIWLHSSGEIIYANAQHSIWLGQFVDMSKLAVGLNLDFNGKTMKFIAEKISEPVKPTPAIPAKNKKAKK